MPQADATREWLLGIGGWLASTERVFGDQGRLIPRAVHLQECVRARLGPSIRVGRPTPDPGLDIGLRGPDVDEADFAPPRAYPVLAAARISGARLLAALAAAVERMPLAMSPGPLTLVVALFDLPSRREVGRRHVTLRKMGRV